MARRIGLGQLDRAQEAIDEMWQIQEVDPSDSRARWITAIAVNVGVMLGDWARARTAADAALAKTDAGSPHVLDPALRAVRSWMLIADGDLDKAVEDAQASLLVTAEQSQDAQVRATALIGAGYVFLAAGRHEDAESGLDGAIAYGDRLVSVLNDTPIVDGGWLAHDLDRRDDYAQCLRPRMHVPWADAAHAIVSGDYRRAADVLGEIGYRPGEAYARLRAAKQLVEAGRRAEADAELQQSLAFWREVGAKRYVREGEALLAASA